MLFLAGSAFANNISATNTKMDKNGNFSITITINGTEYVLPQTNGNMGARTIEIDGYTLFVSPNNGNGNAKVQVLAYPETGSFLGGEEEAVCECASGKHCSTEWHNYYWYWNTNCDDWSTNWDVCDEGEESGAPYQWGYLQCVCCDKSLDFWGNTTKPALPSAACDCENTEVCLCEDCVCDFCNADLHGTSPVVNKGCQNCEGNAPANRCDGSGKCDGNGKPVTGSGGKGGQGNQGGNGGGNQQ